jgi:hypothetical protein
MGWRYEYSTPSWVEVLMLSPETSIADRPTPTSHIVKEGVDTGHWKERR